MFGEIIAPIIVAAGVAGGVQGTVRGPNISVEAITKSVKSGGNYNWRYMRSNSMVGLEKDTVENNLKRPGLTVSTMTDARCDWETVVWYDGIHTTIIDFCDNLAEKEKVLNIDPM